LVSGSIERTSDNVFLVTRLSFWRHANRDGFGDWNGTAVRALALAELDADVFYQQWCIREIFLPP
jgi:hypothetical protein